MRYDLDVEPCRAAQRRDVIQRQSAPGIPCRPLWVIIAYPLAQLDRTTKRACSYEHSVVTSVETSMQTRRRAEDLRDEKRVRGVTALVATASIEAPPRY